LDWLMKSMESSNLDLERYKDFMESIDDGVYETDLQGNLTYFNPAFCQIFGIVSTDLHGQNFSKFMTQEQAKIAFEVFNKIFKTRAGVKDILWEIVDQKGEKRIIELSANLILNQAGHGIGFRGIARNVTERLRAQEELKQSEIRYQCAYEASRVAEKQYKTLLDFVPYPMVVFTPNGEVTYLNPAFTLVFGWTLGELQGKTIPYLPAGYEGETLVNIRRLLREKMIPKITTKRLTKDGRILDVIIRGATFSQTEELPGGVLVIFRDTTQEKKQAETNAAILRISMALPNYPDLEELLDYISSEIKELLNVEGAVVMLLDEEKREIYFKGAAYDDQGTQKRAKEVRFPSDRGVAGEVLRTGKPILVPDTGKDPHFYPVVDHQMNFRSKSILDVPLYSRDRIIGVLCAINKKSGPFDDMDVELLSLIAGTVALSIENARFADEIKKAYQEVSSLNRAKSRAINRLSHELRTPVSVLLASLRLLSRKLSNLPNKDWEKTMERAERNLNRLLDIQYEVQDIMQDADSQTGQLLYILLEQAVDALETFFAEEIGEGALVAAIRKKIDDIYFPKSSTLAEIDLNKVVAQRIEAKSAAFTHRNVEVESCFSPVPKICIPEEVFQKVFDGLLRNAIEATPDDGKVRVVVEPKGGGAQLRVEDRGVGITEENQRRIFEGFFSTQETMTYSSKNPYDFGAGGKGADLLRMKIFSERYHFKLEMSSTRCLYIPNDSDECPGQISLCSFCTKNEDCRQSGGTTFTLSFPPTPASGCGVNADE
jgi:PAS domain S-box-containing protein